jgi:MoaA/NifB/PqqE/SkfB family radical SAM enzyme
MKQESPFAIQIELTEGCNLFCSFCGIHGIRSSAKDYKFMNPGIAVVIAEQIKRTGWNCRIEFAMHGEPTLHPEFKQIITIFRMFLPHHQLMMLTNGIGLLPMPKVEVNRLFYSGLNVLGIDAYNHNPYWKKIAKKVHGRFYPEEGKSPHSRFPKRAREVIYIQDIKEAKSGGHSTLNNHCGCAAPPLKTPMKQRCAKPFREMSIRWDGKIALCCNDWRGHYFCGDISVSGLEEIWNNRAFQIARKMLYNNDRNFIPCKWCDAKSYRIGLLPDKKGKEALAEPTKIEKKWIAQHATKSKTLTKIIKRKWEK